MKRIFMVVAALVATQVFSGCYILREVNWDKDKVEPGTKAKAIVGLQGSGGSGMPRELARGEVEARFFLMYIGVGSDGQTPKRPKFDLDDKTGQKQKLVRNDALLDAAFSESGCSSSIPIRAQERRGGEFGAAFHTEDPVSSDNSKFIDAKVPIKVANDAPGGGFIGVVFAGEWFDDGDGVPEADQDEIRCTGSSTTTYKVKGPQN